jgi:hypothetical protein
LSPTGVRTANAATTPAVARIAPIRSARRDTSIATTALATPAVTVSVRLMFIQPPEPKTSPSPATGTAAASARIAPSATPRSPTHRRRRSHQPGPADPSGSADDSAPAR